LSFFLLSMSVALEKKKKNSTRVPYKGLWEPLPIVPVDHRELVVDHRKRTT
jgi:hypothetical protein